MLYHIPSKMIGNRIKEQKMYSIRNRIRETQETGS